MDGKLAVHAPDGTVERTYSVAGLGERGHQVLAAPTGRKLLLLTIKHLYWVELCENIAPR